MTRTYAAKRLLEHGPLTMGEIVTITGWPVRVCRRALQNLEQTGIVLRDSYRACRPVYRLAP